MKKNILFLLFVLISFVSFGQVYQEMPQYGYRANRMAFDSSLIIPTTCGVPTLRTNITKKAAIAFDSCNNRFYRYNPKTSSWSIIGGSSDTFNLQQVLNKGNTATQSGGTNSISLSDNSGYSSSLGSTGLQPTNNNDNSYGSYSAGNFFLHDGTSQNMTGGVADNGSFLDVSNVYGNKINLTSEQTTNVPYLSWFNNQDGVTQKLLPQYSLANSDIYMPYVNPIDTLATLFDLRNNVPATPNLQQVTDAGIYTTNDMVFTTGYGVGDYSQIQLVNSVANGGGSVYVNSYYNNYLSLNADTIGNHQPYIQWVENTGPNVQVLRPQNAVGSSEIYMPYKNPVDTIATLADLRDINVQNGRFGNDTATVVMAKVHNDAGITLTNGKVVAFSTSGTSSDAPSVKLANNKADSTSATTFGFVSGTIAVNDTGYVVLLGKIEKLNTSAYANGDLIYLDSISGQYTKNKPQAPYHLVYLGTVVKSNAGNGSIYVKVQNGYEMEELHNVKINGVVNNQVIAYSDTQQLWKNRNIYSIVDTVNTVATKSNVALKLNISDTASMLNPYLRKIDTTNKFVNTITRTAGKDSIIFYIGGTRYAIKDSIGGGGGSAAGSTGYVQFNNAGAFAADSSLFWDNTNKRLGIGTTTPPRTFTVVDDNKGTRGIQNDSYGNFSALLAFRRANGTLSSPTQILANDDIGFFGANGYHSGGAFASSSSASIQFTAEENFTSTAWGGRITFGTTPNGSNTRAERLRIANNGNTLIGTTTDAGFKLDVNGTARVVTSLQTPQINGNTTSGGTLTLQSTTNATKGKILFGTSAYDEVNNRLGIGTTSPTSMLHNVSTASSPTTADAPENLTLDRYIANNGAAAPTAILRKARGTSASPSAIQSGDVIGVFGFRGHDGTSFSSGSRAFLSSYAAENWTSTNQGTYFVFGTTANGTTSGTERLRITDGGGFVMNSTNTAAGTTGNQTINKPSGTVNIAALGTTVTVTNSLVTASSIVFAVIRTNDATATIKNVVPGAGSFTINLTAATTAETSIGFFVIN